MDQTAALRLRQAIGRTEDATRGRGAVGRRPEDADDVLGTFATDGALGFDPFPFLQALHDVGSRAVVIGQVAGIMHGSTELTGDLDLLWDGTPDEAHALREALARCGCAELPDLDRVQVGYRVTGAVGDLCTPGLPWGAMAVAPCLTRAETTHDAAGFTIRYAALDDLIRMRRALGRPKDLRRADELVRLHP
ncbi:hypothetical protein [Streptomyces griseorubiginosus]|uniref:hypothetical protein n=1 Tax=Streptomyces griseorubiginosus TaxID=67304 RepID=UPI002E80FF0E|nr:hypothetical protein [Streptomyces griseorubiginosus]WUB44674.1 hypothetical protein OHN19_15540 [Streptomyces griseorubiginosus]WUB53191.1 hypothetical protein OG942_15535 [Streptomyces griseorubiginosus]